MFKRLKRVFKRDDKAVPLISLLVFSMGIFLIIDGFFIKSRVENINFEDLYESTGELKSYICKQNHKGWRSTIKVRIKIGTASYRYKITGNPYCRKVNLDTIIGKKVAIHTLGSEVEEDEILSLTSGDVVVLDFNDKKATLLKYSNQSIFFGVLFVFMAFYIFLKEKPID